MSAAIETDKPKSVNAPGRQYTMERTRNIGIAAHIDAGDRICERQLDRLMERYQTSNADFYGAYQVARIIVDAGGGSGNGGTPPPTTPPATPHP